MKTCAIIAEYDPFHAGHARQIRLIREAFGEDTRVISIMSGNFTERGSTAVADKYLRAKAAVLCGVDLVLELPFPFSMLSAEFFAGAGVHIANAIGVVDLLSFGSESGDLGRLSQAVEAQLTEDFAKNLGALSEERPEAGYPALAEAALTPMIGDCGDLFSPNQILALEYLKALKRTGSRILPHTVRRVGQDFSDDVPGRSAYPSASAIRAASKKDPYSAIEMMPEKVRPLFREALGKGEFPCSVGALSPAILSYFRLNAPDPAKTYHDAAGGLYTRLRNASFEATDLSALISLASTKKYTDARLRRAVLCSFFGVTSSDAKEKPAYTQLLASGPVGLGILKEIKKASDFPVLTKPSAVEALSADAKRQKERSDLADAIFALTSPIPVDGRRTLRQTPFIL